MFISMGTFLMQKEKIIALNIITNLLEDILTQNMNFLTSQKNTPSTAIIIQLKEGSELCS